MTFPGKSHSFTTKLLHIVTCLFIVVSSAFALEAPVFTPDGGAVIAPKLLEIENPNPNGVIFYTTDGTDPRNLRGGVRSSAWIHRTPVAVGKQISVNRSMTVNARIKSGDNWSDMKTATFEADQDFSKLLITEVMYHPTGGPDDSEFVEFKNIGETVLDLENLQLNDLLSEYPRLSMAFPEDTLIPPGEFFLLVRNPDIFQLYYPEIPFHGLLVSKMDNRSALLALLGPDGSIATRMKYDTYAPWPVIPDNHGLFHDLSPNIGFSLTRKTLDPRADPEHFTTWRASAARLGSPGTDDPEPGFPPLRINEIRSRSADGLDDAVEIYNPSSEDVNIGGWWLSKSRTGPYQYQFPAEMVVPAKGYLVVDESDFIAGGFALRLNSGGDECYLFSGDSQGELTGYSHGVKFHGSERNASLGYSLTSEGSDFFLPEMAPSFGQENTGASPPSLVISEIMHNPTGDGFPYVEVHNPGPDPLQLWDPDNPDRSWAIRGGVDPSFPAPSHFPLNTTVQPGGYLICVPPTVEAVDIPDQVEFITISNFSFPFQKGAILIQRPSGDRYVTVDIALYQNDAPWDMSVAGGGQALERIDINTLGAEPKNWCAGPIGGTPGLPWNGSCVTFPVPEVSTSNSGSQFTLTLPSEPDYFYFIEESRDLASWHRLPDTTRAGDGTPLSFTRDVSGSGFLRITIDDKP